jgi:hypothetical protein
MSSESNQRDNQTNNGESDNIHTGGGAYIRGNITNSGGINQFGGTIDEIVYTDNRYISAADEATLRNLFDNLYQQIDAAPDVTPEEKADAKEAANALEIEVEAAKKDPSYKPSRVTMRGLIAAFKNVGVPVLSIAMQILGFPPLGAAINAFASALPDDK